MQVFLLKNNISSRIIVPRKKKDIYSSILVFFSLENQMYIYTCTYT